MPARKRKRERINREISEFKDFSDVSFFRSP